jgi:hypothetical protein
MPRSLLVGFLGAAVLAAGCGSTVQQRGLTQAGAGSTDGLGGSGSTGVASGTAGQGLDGVAGLGGSTATAAGGGPQSQPGSTGQLPTATQSGVADAPAASVGAGGPDIRIGYPVVDTTGVSTLAGFNNANQQAAPGQKEDKDFAEALISYANHTGGVGGRKIVGYPVPVTVPDAIDSARREALCVRSTEDDKVNFFIDNEVFSTESDFACFQKHHVPIFGALVSEAPRHFLLQGWPYMFTARAALDRTAIATAEGLHQGGWFNSAGAVGVILDDTPSMHEVYDKLIAPRLKAYGVKQQLPRYFPQYEPNGQATASQSAILAFRQAGVDRVLFEVNILSVLAFANSADNQGYRPRYGLGDYARLDAAVVNIAGNVDAIRRQAANALAVSSDQLLVANARQRKVKAQAEAGGPLIRDAGALPAGMISCLDIVSKELKTDYYKASPKALDFDETCDSFFLWLQSVRRAGEASPAGAARGVAATGTGFISAQVGGTTFGAGAPDGADKYRIGLFVDADSVPCKCYVPKSETWYRMNY